MSKPNSNGRSTREASFVMLPKYLIKGEAYKALKPIARALLVEILFFYNGGNNGEIHMSIRKAASLLSCANNTAHKALKDLMEKGFIKPRKKGSFTLKRRHATEWIITLHGYNNQLPTKEFAKWTQSEKKPVSKIDKTVLNFETAKTKLNKKRA